MLRDTLTTQMKEAMKAGDKERLSTIRLIQAEIKSADINNRSEDSRDGITDTEILSLLQSMIKKRRDSVQQYEAGGRPELAAKEQAEIAVIESFLPQQMSEAEMQTAIDKAVAATNASSIKDMGPVMGYLKEQYTGQMDLGKAGQMVKQKLGA